MKDLDLPYRLIDVGEQPIGERVNVYHKMKTFRDIIDSLEEDKIQLIRDPSLGGLLNFLKKSAWYASDLPNYDKSSNYLPN